MLLSKLFTRSIGKAHSHHHLFSPPPSNDFYHIHKKKKKKNLIKFQFLLSFHCLLETYLQLFYLLFHWLFSFFCCLYYFLLIKMKRLIYVIGSVFKTDDQLNLFHNAIISHCNYSGQVASVHLFLEEGNAQYCAYLLLQNNWFSSHQHLYLCISHLVFTTP